MSALGVCERIFEIMDEPIQIQSGSIRDELKSSPIIVEFRNASFAYPTKPSVVVLKHVNLKIRKGESVALVGASGSGKSSIVSLILRFYDLVEGELYIGGRNIKTLDLNYLRRQMGFVAQEPVLFSGSLKENIEYGLEEHGNDEKVMRALEIANAKEFVLNEDKFPEKLYKNLVDKQLSHYTKWLIRCIYNNNQFSWHLSFVPLTHFFCSDALLRVILPSPRPNPSKKDRLWLLIGLGVMILCPTQSHCLSLQPHKLHFEFMSLFADLLSKARWTLSPSSVVSRFSGSLLFLGLKTSFDP